MSDPAALQGEATLQASDAAGAVWLQVGGNWLVANAAALDRQLRALAVPKGRAVRLDLGRLDRLDTTGAWLLIRTEKALSAGGSEVTIENLRPSFAPLFEQLRQRDTAPAAAAAAPPRDSFQDFLARIGLASAEFATRAYDLLCFFGIVCVALLGALRNPRRLRLTAIVAQMEQTGLNALPIVGLLSFLIGVVFAYQGADQLRRFGAEIYTVNLLGIAVLREMGVLLTAIIFAGRSGSAFTAQIGTMQVNEEIDALRTLGLDPIEVLVIPRLLALVLVLPMLAFFADLMGLLGGCIMSWGVLGISIPQFTRQLQSALTAWTFWIGLIKAPFFALIIGLTGCYEGFRVSRSAESVGRLTTFAVVESIFLVIVVDALFSILFSLLRI